MSDDRYSGPAVLHADGAELPVTVDLAGRFEPTDGRYHWGGRIHPEPDVAALARGGRRQVSVATAGAEPVQARLGEVDPWGGVRITGAGRPPWTVPS